MKTKQTNCIVAILICLTILFTVSCDMFTNSLLKGAARDMSEMMKNASTSELLAAGADPDVIGDPAAAQAAMEALAEKDLSNISAEEASNVCSLASSAILPVSTLMDAIDKIKDSTKDDNSENTDGSQTEEVNESVKVVSEILSSIPAVDTTAIEQVLGNDELVKEAEIGSVAMATVSLMASSLSKADLSPEEQQEQLDIISKKISEIKPEDIKDGVTTDVIDKVLEGTAFEDDTAMKTAVKAALTLKNRDDISSLTIGGFNLGELIGVKDNENSSN